MRAGALRKCAATALLALAALTFCACGDDDDDGDDDSRHPAELVGTWKSETRAVGAYYVGEEGWVQKDVAITLVMKEDGTLQYYLGDALCDDNMWVVENNHFYYGVAPYYQYGDAGNYAVMDGTLTFGDGVGPYFYREDLDDSDTAKTFYFKKFTKS